MRFKRDDVCGDGWSCSEAVRMGKKERKGMGRERKRRREGGKEGQDKGKLRGESIRMAGGCLLYINCS